MTAQLCVSPHCVMPGTHLADVDPDHDPEQCRGCAPALAADGLYLCQRCVATMERDIWKAAVLYRALGQALVGGGGGERGGGGGGHDVELHPVAVEARDAIKALLVALCRMIAHERGVELPEPDMVAVARYLTRHVRWLAAHPAADEHAHDLRDAATDPRSWGVAYTVPSDRRLIGVCNQTVSAPSDDPGAESGGAEWICGTRLYRREGEQAVACLGCGRSESVQWWRWELCAGADVEPVMDAYEAAAWLSWRWGREVQPGTVRKWGQRWREQAGLLVDADGRAQRDELQRVLFDREALEARATKLWGPAEDASSAAA
jgi:hypothetical protein